MATVVEDPPKFDKKAVAEILGVQVRWVDRAIAENRIESVKVGALVRFRQSALDRFVAENTRPAAGDAEPAPRSPAKVAKRGSRSKRVPVSS